MVTGSTPPTSDKQNYSSNDVCFVKPSDIGQDGITDIQETEFHISEYAYNNTNRKLPKGSVLVTCIGIIGKVGILTKEATCNQQINAVIPNSAIMPRYLAYCIKSIRKALQDKANAPVVPILNKGQFSSFQIPVPPLPVQQQICSLLDKLSRVIEAKKEQLKELDNLAQAIFYDMFGDPITNDKGWDVMTIGEVCKSKNSIIRANNYFDDSDTIDYIDISSIDNTLNIIISTSSFVFSEAPSRAQQKVEKDDLLISLVRPNLKNIALVSDSKTTTVASSGFCVLRASLVSPYYLKYLVITKEFTEYLCKRVCGISYPAVKEFDIKGCPIGVPPLLLQQAFAEKVEAIERQKELINQSIREVQTLFDSRMDYWFSD